jgi:ABC-type enterochelin transport system substrate-binding protein
MNAAIEATDSEINKKTLELSWESQQQKRISENNRKTRLIKDMYRKRSETQFMKTSLNTQIEAAKAAIADENRLVLLNKDHSIEEFDPSSSSIVEIPEELKIKVKEAKRLLK